MRFYAGFRVLWGYFHFFFIVSLILCDIVSASLMCCYGNSRSSE